MLDFPGISLLKSEFSTEKVVYVIPVPAFATNRFQRSVWIMYAHVDTLPSSYSNTACPNSLQNPSAPHNISKSCRFSAPTYYEGLR